MIRACPFGAPGREAKRRTMPMSFTEPSPAPADTRPVLVGDLGGTNCRLALAQGLMLLPGSLFSARTRAWEGAEALLFDYLRRLPDKTRPERACLAVAGPVRQGCVRLINAGWSIEARALARRVGLGDVLLVNDLQAHGYSIRHLPAEAVLPLLTPSRAAARPRCCSTTELTRLAVGLGTGFNAVPVHLLPGGEVFVPPSEAGHSHLPRHGAEEEALARFLAEDHGIATIEAALGGPGLGRLHAFLTGKRAASEEILAACGAADPAARRTVALYARLLGRTLGSLALIHLPFGGIYLFGGLARAIAPFLLPSGLATTYSEIGRLSSLVQDIPLFVVTAEETGLIGCAAHLAGR